MSIPLLQRYNPLRVFCQTVLPAVYDDSLSYYEVLCKVVARLNEETEVWNTLLERINLNTEEINKLKDLFQDFVESGFNDYYKDQVEQWITDNLEYVFTHLVKQVFFGLNQEGYFVAYIPQSWSDIIFDTGWNFNEDTYGRLILRWDVDSAYTVDQTSETVSEKPHGSPIQTANLRPVVEGGE